MDMLQYLDPDGLDETVLNIGQIKTNLEGQISGLGESIEEELQNLSYARPDGIYPDMTVGAVIGADETAQWATRESTGTGSATVRSVQGAAVVWNQLNDNGGTANTTGLTRTYNADGSVTLNGTASSGSMYFSSYFNYTANHKMLVRGCPSGGDGAFEMSMGGVAIDTGEGAIASYGSGATTRLVFTVRSTYTFDNVTFWPQIFDLTAMFGIGNEPTTVAEFEQMFHEPYYPYSAPTLKPVQIAGIKSVGFNQWDGVFDRTRRFDYQTGEWGVPSGWVVTSEIPAFGNETYYVGCDISNNVTPSCVIGCWNANDEYLGWVKYGMPNSTFTTLQGTAYIRAEFTYFDNLSNICVNISNPALNGQYKPYTTDAIEWTAQTLRAAGSVADMLYSDHVDVKVGERAYQSGDESDATVRTDGTTTYYPLTTPTTQPISPALPMTYRVQAGGSESIIVPDGEVSAAPVLTVAEPVNAGDEFSRIWAAIESLGYTRNAAQLSRPVSLTDIGSIDEVQKDTTDVVEKEAAEVAEIDTVKEIKE